MNEAPGPALLAGGTSGTPEAGATDVFGALFRQQARLGGKIPSLPADGVRSANADSATETVGGSDALSARTCLASTRVDAGGSHEGNTSSRALLSSLVSDVSGSPAQESVVPRATDFAIEGRPFEAPRQGAGVQRERTNASAESDPGGNRAAASHGAETGSAAVDSCARGMNPAAAEQETAAPGAAVGSANQPGTGTAGESGSSGAGNPAGEVSGSGAMSRMQDSGVRDLRVRDLRIRDLRGREFGLRDFGTQLTASGGSSVSGRAPARAVHAAHAPTVRPQESRGSAQKQGAMHHAAEKARGADSSFSGTVLPTLAAGGEAAGTAIAVGSTSGPMALAAQVSHEFSRSSSVHGPEDMRVPETGGGNGDGAASGDSDVNNGGAAHAKAGGVGESDGMAASSAAMNESGQNDGSADLSRSREGSVGRGPEVRSVLAAVSVHPEPAPGAAAPGPGGVLTAISGTVHAAPAAVSAGTTTSGRSSSSAHPGEVAPGIAFERMDGAAAPRVIESTPQRLAVGLRDAGLGWVEIRAHASGGQVAAVVGTTAAAHPAIAAELPSMRAYLAEQQVRLGHLAAEDLSAWSGDGQGNASGSSGGRQPGGDARSGEPGHRGGDTSVSSSLAVETGTETLSYISVRV